MIELKNVNSSYDGSFPCLIRRCIDDIVGATSLPLASLQNFINYTNNFHQALQFTHTISEYSVPFLDIQLTIQDNSITTFIFYKETDSHSFLDYFSYHLQKCRNSIPSSQQRCLRRICSSNDDLQEKAKEMTSFLYNILTWQITQKMTC